MEGRKIFGIGVGPSGQENQQYQNLSGVSSTAANMGLGDISSSTNFMQAILSGNPTAIGQVLGPQISAIQGQGQQQKDTNAQFGNRSGGTNASNQMIDTNTRSQVNNLISNLTGTAVSGLASTGTNLLNTGVQGFGTAFGEANTMQQQNEAKLNDIFSSAASFAAAPFTGGASLGLGQLSLPGTGGSSGTFSLGAFTNPTPVSTEEPIFGSTIGSA